MSETKPKLIRCNHIMPFIQLLNSINYCMICSAFLFTSCSSNNSAIKTIKPNNFDKKVEINPSFLSLSLQEEINLPTIYFNKKDYLKQRAHMIKNIKNICTYFALSLKSYFLSVEYFDKICSEFSSFNPDSILEISFFCVILAAKFNEETPKAIHIQKILRNKITKNYLEDEKYVLHLLNYKLNMLTPYDILMDILHSGFIFEGEDFNYQKMCYIYSNLESILYVFSQNNSYIDMSPKQKAVSIIAFARELLELNQLNDVLKQIFCINENNEQDYISGMNTIKKHIKIEKNIKNNKKSGTNQKLFKEKNINNKTAGIFCNKNIN